MTRVIPLGFQSSIKQLRVERVNPTPIYATIKIVGEDQYQQHKEEMVEYNKAHPSHWRIWLMANGDFTLGTFIQLLDNGTISLLDGTELFARFPNLFEEEG